MEILPPEVQDLVLSQLRIKDLCALIATSKTMRSIVDRFSSRIVFRRNKAGDNAWRRVKKTLKWKDFPLTHRVSKVM